MKIRIPVAILFLLLFLSQVSQAQILNDILKAKDKIAGVTVDKLSKDPITTSFSNVDKSNIEPEHFITLGEVENIHAQPFNPETGFTLAPGTYEAKFQSFCIKAGTYLPTRGSGRFYAEMKGPKADIFETILTALHTDRSLSQRDVQLLLWAIIAKTDFQKMKGPIKVTALRILTPEQIARLSKGALENIGRKKLNKLAYKNDALRTIIEAENNLRAKFYAGVKDYAAYEEIAMIAGVEPVVAGYEVGKWTKHPDGYYIRYYPSGYSATNTQVYVPESSGSVVFNAFGHVAVPASTGSQRLLQTNLPWGNDDWGYANLPDNENNDEINECGEIVVPEIDAIIQTQIVNQNPESSSHYACQRLENYPSWRIKE